MVTYKNGDLLESGCEVICHQVNLQGIMGGGLALQIAEKYPQCKKRYSRFVRHYPKKELLLGRVQFVNCNGLNIINCFSQNENFTTNYEKVKQCFLKIKDIMRCLNFRTLGIPYKYGCGIANGEWEKVNEIIHEIFDNSEIRCEVWKL